MVSAEIDEVGLVMVKLWNSKEECGKNRYYDPHQQVVWEFSESISYKTCQYQIVNLIFFYNFSFTFSLAVLPLSPISCYK